MFAGDIAINQISRHWFSFWPEFAWICSRKSNLKNLTIVCKLQT